MGSPIGDFAVRQLARLAKLQEVAWTRYATAYDWLLLHDAAYREILSDFEEECGSWTLRDDEIIVDIGAGTGNFSIAAARTHPATQVFHIDADMTMNAAAADKAADRGLTNISFVTADVADIDFTSFRMAGAVIAVHALYAIPAPVRVMRQVTEILRPGGVAYFVDIGRPVRLGEWSKYLPQNMSRGIGRLRNMSRFWRIDEMVHRDRRIGRGAARPEAYWQHTPDEFLASVRAVGLDVRRHAVMYRGHSDLVVGIKSH